MDGRGPISSRRVRSEAERFVGSLRSRQAQSAAHSDLLRHLDRRGGLLVRHAAERYPREAELRPARMAARSAVDAFIHRPIRAAVPLRSI